MATATWPPVNYYPDLVALNGVPVPLAVREFEHFILINARNKYMGNGHEGTENGNNNEEKLCHREWGGRDWDRPRPADGGLVIIYVRYIMTTVQIHNRANS